jgi:hypothetical protein
MKKLSFFITCLFILACKHDNLKSDNKKDGKYQKMSFGISVHGIFKNKDRYYLSKCYSCFNYDSRNEESSIIEITLNQVILSCPDHHGRITYKIDSLGDNSVGVEYESHFNHMGNEIVDKGRFVYNVSNRVDTIALYVDGLPINGETANRHIQKNKFYILNLAPTNGIITVGVEKETYCSKKMFEKYGFKPYLIGHCIPSKYHEEQIKVYNNLVFNYLKKSKKFSYENYEVLQDKYNSGKFKCGVSEWMDKNNLGNGKTQKEIWEEIVRKHKNLPEGTRSIDSTSFWFTHIRSIFDLYDTVDLESPLKMAEKENDYLIKHGLILSCVVLVNWKNINNLDKQFVNRIDNVATDVQSKYFINKTPNLAPWNSHYGEFKKKFKK